VEELMKIHPSHEWPPGGFRCIKCGTRVTSIDVMLRCPETELDAAHEPEVALCDFYLGDDVVDLPVRRK
jgi:hypothetical protein